MHLEEFLGSPNREKHGQPRVTLNRRGVMVMNEKAYKAFDMPGAVKLFYDENEMVIALKPVDPQRRNAFRLKQKHTARILNTLPFCRHFRIFIDGTLLFNDLEIDTEGTMLLSLKNTSRISRRWD